MKYKIISLLVFMFLLTGCTQLPAVVDSKDYVNMKNVESYNQVEQQKIIATTVAYSNTVELKKLQSDNELKAFENRNASQLAETRSNNFWGTIKAIGMGIVYIIISVGLIIIVGGILITLFSALSQWFESDEKKHESRLNYGLLSQKEDNRHKEIMTDKLFQHRENMLQIGNYHVERMREIEISERTYLALIDKFGKSEADDYIRKVDDMGKFIILNPNGQFMLEDKQQYMTVT